MITEISKKSKNSSIIILILLVIIYLFLNREQLKFTILNQLILLRGILAPNCNWFKISDLLLNDGAGVNIYNNYKQNYGDFVPINMFGTKLYMVTNNEYVKTILYNSPNLFSVGKLKKNIF